MDQFLTDTNIIAVYIFICIDVNMGVHETFCTSTFLDARTYQIGLKCASHFSGDVT